jgi:hypothetical protein
MRVRTLSCFESYVRRFGDHPIAYYGIALVWYHSPELVEWPERARRALEQSLRLDPDNGFVRMTQALVFFESGRLEDARRAIALVNREEFLDPKLAWRLLKLDEVDLACRAKLGYPIADLEWADLVARYERQSLENDGVVASPREAIEAATLLEHRRVAEALARVANPRRL